MFACTIWDSTVLFHVKVKVNLMLVNYFQLIYRQNSTKSIELWQKIALLRVYDTFPLINTSLYVREFSCLNFDSNALRFMDKMKKRISKRSIKIYFRISGETVDKKLKRISLKENTH